jgi:transposase
MGRVQVLGNAERRRRWRDDEKARIVEESLTSGLPVSEVARRNDVCSSLVFAWRRQMQAGLLGEAGAPLFLPVAMSAGAVPSRVTTPPARLMPEPDPSRSLGPVLTEIDSTATAHHKSNRASDDPHRNGMIEIHLQDGVRLVVDHAVDGGALSRVLAALGTR